jgi:hypothetical protein
MLAATRRIAFSRRRTCWGTDMLSTVVGYCREDSEFAHRLAADLRAAGASVSLAPLDVASSERWSGAVGAALARCTGLLVILSPAAIRSASIDDGVRVAVGRKIPIVAVLRRDCEIPLRLRNVELVDFRKDYAGGVLGLLAKIAPAQAGRASTPATPAIQTARQTSAETAEHAHGGTDARRPAAVNHPQAPASVQPAGNTPNAERIPTGTSHGRPLQLLGGTLLAVSLAGLLCVMPLAGSALDSGTAWEVAGIGLILVFLIAFAGVKSLKRGKQIGALSAQALLARDSRPPVLYLRSFQDDSVGAEGSLKMMPLGGGLIVGGMIAMLDLAGGAATEEEQLAEALHDVGPFVAVGKPGEKLPQLGAARMYLQDTEWRDAVHELMSRAGLVVLRAGRTDGLWWEVQTAAEIVRPERIVFLLPYEREQYELFRSRAATFFRRRLPDYPKGKKKGTAGSVQGILYFESDWTPHFLQPLGFYRSSKPWVRTFKATLQPVFKQIDVDVKIPKTSVWKVLLLVVLSPIVALVTMFVVLFVISRVMALLEN